MDIEDLAERLKDGYYATAIALRDDHIQHPDFWPTYARWWADNGKW